MSQKNNNDDCVSSSPYKLARKLKKKKKQKKRGKNECKIKTKQTGTRIKVELGSLPRDSCPAHSFCNGIRCRSPQPRVYSCVPVNSIQYYYYSFGLRAKYCNYFIIKYYYVVRICCSRVYIIFVCALNRNDAE